MNRRTVLQGLMAVPIALLGLHEVKLRLPAIRKVKPAFSSIGFYGAMPIQGWPVLDEVSLSMPHGGGPAWLEIVVKPCYVPKWGTLVIVDLQKNFGCTFTGIVMRIESADDNFKVHLVEKRPRTDI